MRLARLSRFFKPEEVAQAPEEVAVNQRLLEQVEAQQNRDFSRGFLHIPKTGGSGIDDMMTKIAARGLACPVKFDHAWRMQDVLRLYPDISLSFVLRDPIERMASGFVSRLRMGRPRNNKMWSADEAIAFGYFKTPVELFEALTGDDERLRSAAKFACHGIQHLRFNYRYYFESTKWINKHRRNIGVVGRLEAMDDFLVRFAEYAELEHEICVENYARVHVNARPVSAELTPRLREALRGVFKREYRVYDYLQTFVAS